MPHAPLANLAQRLQQLLEQRQKHANALEQIDKTLAQVSAALDAKAVTHPTGKPAASTVASSPALAGGKRKRRKAQKFAVTANDLVLGYVKANRNPTTAEINRHWKSAGRNGAADNTLSLLVKKKLLKRTPIGGGIPGSRYSLAQT